MADQHATIDPADIENDRPVSRCIKQMFELRSRTGKQSFIVPVQNFPFIIDQVERIIRFPLAIIKMVGTNDEPDFQAFCQLS